MIRVTRYPNQTEHQQRAWDMLDTLTALRMRAHQAGDLVAVERGRELERAILHVLRGSYAS